MSDRPCIVCRGHFDSTDDASTMCSRCWASYRKLPETHTAGGLITWAAQRARRYARKESEGTLPLCLGCGAVLHSARADLATAIAWVEDGVSLHERAEPSGEGGGDG